MKNYILDSTYKDAVIVNQNSEFSITPTSTLTNSSINGPEVSSIQLSNAHISHQNQNSRLNKFNFIDCI